MVQRLVSDGVVEALAAQAGGGEPPCVVAPPATATRLSLTATRLGRSLAGVELWRRGGFLEVRREPPRVTARGKIPPVQTLAGPDRSGP